MKEHSDSLSAAVFTLLLPLVVSCSAPLEGIYQGGKLMTPGPLKTGDSYNFLFLDKWRIRFSWITGPADIRYCHISRTDEDPRLEDRFIEIDGVMKRERVWEGGRDSGKKFIGILYEKVYGTNNRTGKFEGYDAFCTHTFQDIWTGISVFLIAPDSAKGTDEWIAGAKRVTVGNNQWLRKDDPPADYSQTPGKWAAPIETWTLPLADGKYWLVMRLGGSTGGYGNAMGINRNPLKYEQVKAVFHQMIESVRIEPLR
jgi:hypothetical protein